MARSRKKASKSPNNVSPSSTKIEDNLFEIILFEVLRFDGNFDIWEIKMRAFLKSEGIEIWESMIDDSRMDRESKEYNAKVAKTILNGLPDSVKKNLGKHSSKKDISDKIHDLHSKGALTMTINQEGDPEPIIKPENKNAEIAIIKKKTSPENNGNDYVVSETKKNKSSEI